MDYKKLINEVKTEKSVNFNFKGEKFQLFIDWEKDLCLTHYAKDGENAWLVGDLGGIKHKLKQLIEDAVSKLTV